MPATSPDDALDPKFYLRSQNTTCWPPRPFALAGFSFDPATGTFDFSAVPGFDLSRLAFVQHVSTGRILYGRPVDPWCGAAAIDGVPVPLYPRSGKVIRLKLDTSDLRAEDELYCEYDRSPT